MGPGKSECLPKIVRLVRAMVPDRELIVCREPGGTAIGERIRTALLEGHDGPPPAAMTEMLAFAAARSQLVDEVVRPALARGAIVICDRYMDSAIAYQGYGRGLSLAVVRDVQSALIEAPVPDLTVLFDRAAGSPLLMRRTETDYIESEAPGFHERVRAGYIEMSREDPARWRVVDAARSLDEVIDEVWGHIATCLARQT